MSTNLSWRPSRPKNQKFLSTGFKQLIIRSNATIANRGEFTMGTNDIAYLEGVRDAGSGDVAKDAQTLIDAIYKHDSVTLKEE